MIKEIIQSLLTTCPVEVRKLGYLSEIIAIESRYQRQKIYWDSHLNNSKHFILKMAQKSLQRKKINIIGAGILLDVPVHELTQIFDEVVLIDILFLPKIQKRFKNHNNVKLLQVDISGVVKEAYKSPLTYPIPILPEIPQADVTVSANLLSQLPLLPMEYLNTENKEWGKLIIEKHLELLQKNSPLSILLCETNQIYYDKNGKMIEDNDMMFGVKLPEAQDQWIWNIAPRGEDSKDYSIEGTVKAITLVNEFSHR